MKQNVGKSEIEFSYPVSDSLLIRKIDEKAIWTYEIKTFSLLHNLQTMPNPSEDLSQIIHISVSSISVLTPNSSYLIPQLFNIRVCRLNI